MWNIENIAIYSPWTAWTAQSIVLARRWFRRATGLTLVCVHRHGRRTCRSCGPVWCQRCDMLGLRAVARSKEEAAVTRFAQNLRTDFVWVCQKGKDGTWWYTQKIISSLDRLTIICASLTSQSSRKLCRLIVGCSRSNFACRIFAPFEELLVS